MDQVKLFKVVFHKFYLVHSWMLCSIYYTCFIFLRFVNKLINAGFLVIKILVTRLTECLQCVLFLSKFLILFQFESIEPLKIVFGGCIINFIFSHICLCFDLSRFAGSLISIYWTYLQKGTSGCCRSKVAEFRLRIFIVSAGGNLKFSRLYCVFYISILFFKDITISCEYHLFYKYQLLPNTIHFISRRQVYHLKYIVERILHFAYK